MPEAVIAAAVRSPIGRAVKGSLRDVRPDDLATQVVQAALGQVPMLDAAQMDDLMLGCGLPGGQQGFNMARRVAVLAGLDDVGGTTVNRYCASSVQTARMAMHAIRAGEGHAFISAGVESVSSYQLGTSDRPPAGLADLPQMQQAVEQWRNPHFAEARQRTQDRSAGDYRPWSDPRSQGRVPDVYISMGETAENVAELRGISREEQDEFACRSQNAAERARDEGFWDREITPITLPDGTRCVADDGIRAGTSLEKLAALEPVFRPDGTVTAGNACPLNDGAAALIIVSDVRARELGITPLARIVATGVSALSPEIMGLGPVGASRRALANASMTMQDIDLVEINEAFAAQVIPSARDLGVPLERLNVFGGSIAVGHPFGMTGARLITTMLNGLRTLDRELGLVTMCVGGGQGMAMILERLR
ncbi:acetyl-CoA C-acetyltransferase [Intrasporangium calvum]|uniref:acetyl-CoA C-acyltransferase n=1 Tax=Intrasporangium calvum TaxID=53358 RepID=A0ABT5GE60_9MICO|nr:acetyl-CoA C-acetyltransferase [Intrasporangium calvum]MDC5696533.1 acetyl-CoA C-acetyltransferase [Intrasporangium calvum]